MDDGQLAQLADLIVARLGKSPEILTTEEAAKYMRVSRQWLEIAHVRGGGPPFIKFSRLVRYRRIDLDEWLEARIKRHTSALPN